MLIDLLASDSYNFYNISLAKKLGLECSVYVSCLLNQFRKNSDKDYIEIDRGQVKEESTFDISKQKELDKTLIQLGFLVVHDTDKRKFKVDVFVLTNLFLTENESLMKDVIASVVPKKKTKSDAIKTELRTYISSSNSELRDAYSEWIDSVFARQGWMSKKSVMLGQQLIDNYTNRNLDQALEILNIASVNGYRDIQWAINEYEKRKKSNTNKIAFNPVLIQSQPQSGKCVEISNDVF